MPNGLAPSPTPSPSPSPPLSVVVTPTIPSHTHPLPPIPYHNQPNNQLGPQHQNLAPPRVAPHGPRLPSSFTNNRSRSPSPDRFTPHPSPHPDHYESAKPHFTYNNHSTTTDDSSFSEVEFEHDNPAQPSAKALGKRRQVAEEDADSELHCILVFRAYRLIICFCRFIRS